MNESAGKAIKLLAENPYRITWISYSFKDYTADEFQNPILEEV